MNAASSYPPSATHHAYMDHHAHMAHGHPQPQPQPYPHYQPSGPMMHHHVSSYAHPHPYGYGPPLASPHAVQPHYASYPPQHHAMSLPAMAPAPAPPPTAPQETFRAPDSTGQISPPGMRPKVTATLWEDEGTLCFQVEHDGICVARREDNHMINGTKLLNVARMTRGRRDGILKSEKVRNVVKIGPMHLKGVWIPYERALEFANKEKITEALYPLFVHNVGALLHQPMGQNVASARRGDSNSRSSQNQAQVQSQTQTTQAPVLPQHQSMANPGGAHSQQPPHSIAPHPSSGRPGMERAHTYPTPPSNNTNMMGLGNSGSSYEYATHAPIDSKSMPTTPATTPPGSSLQNMPQYTTSSQQSYDGSRHSYSVPPAHQSPYGGVPVTQAYYGKGDMAPPARTTKEEDSGDGRAVYANERVYGYNASVGGPSQLEQVSPSDAKSSPQNASGVTTPRAVGGTPHWQPAYSTPQRAQTLQSSSLAYTPDDGRSDAAAVATNGYPVQPTSAHSYSYANGPTAKRGREVDDDADEYAVPGGHEHDGLKRRKTFQEDTVSSHPRSAMVQQR